MDSSALNVVGMHLMKVREVLRRPAELIAVAHVVCAFSNTAVGQELRARWESSIFRYVVKYKMGKRIRKRKLRK
ncbi:hypothetical protein LguiA_010153 [Lonicera macranthoides]